MRLKFCLLILLSLFSLPVTAQDDSPDPLVQALSLLPYNASIRESLISYVNLAATEQGQPGAPVIVSSEDGVRFSPAELRDLDSVHYGLGSLPFVGLALRDREDFRSINGFDFFDIEQYVYAGFPPEQVQIYLGDFDSAAISSALMAWDYELIEADSPSLLCWVEGCDQGNKMDIRTRDPRFVFGGDLGRHFPTLVSDSQLLMSPDFDSLSSVQTVAQGEGQSLYDAPEIRAIVDELGERAGIVRDLQLISPFTAGLDQALMPDLLSPDSDALEGLRDLDYDTLPLPVYLGFADMPTAEYEYSVILFSYADSSTAQMALDELLVRYETVPSIMRPDSSIQEIIASRGGSLSDTYVYESESSSYSVAVLVFENPQPEYEIDSPSNGDTLVLLQSALVHRLFYDMLLSRDVLWFSNEIEIAAAEQKQS